MSSVRGQHDRRGWVMLAGTVLRRRGPAPSPPPARQATAAPPRLPGGVAAPPRPTARTGPTADRWSGSAGCRPRCRRRPAARVRPWQRCGPCCAAPTTGRCAADVPDPRAGPRQRCGRCDGSGHGRLERCRQGRAAARQAG
ncbi:hypothetical protein L083_4634 [Actinoplanes sp. N902-109]|nr:hypothetical protein L083_4634 [Actinoplanes sp. N902-109]